MSRGFRDWISARGGEDGELDALLAGTWEDGAAALAGVLDIEAGKAALLGALREQHAAGGPWHRTPGEDSAVAAVCEEVGVLLATVTAGSGHDSGPAHSAVIAYMLAARQALIQLRAGLSRRSLAKAGALQLAGNAGHALAEAAGTLQWLPPAAGPADAQEAAELTELISGVRQRLEALSSKIERLFDEAGDAAPRVPAPHR